MQKWEVVLSEMKALSNVVLVATWTKFTRSHSNSDVVFSCADKLESLSPHSDSSRR